MDHLRGDVAKRGYREIKLRLSVLGKQNWKAAVIQRRLDNSIIVIIRVTFDGTL